MIEYMVVRLLYCALFCHSSIYIEEIVSGALVEKTQRVLLYM